MERRRRAVGAEDDARFCMYVADAREREKKRERERGREGDGTRASRRRRGACALCACVCNNVMNERTMERVMAMFRGVDVYHRDAERARTANNQIIDSLHVRYTRAATRED